MEASEPAPEERACSVHPEEPAVGRCTSCGRPACLACAVPVRGRMMCAECATREAGAPGPVVEDTRRPRSRWADVTIAGLLATGLAMTIAPWHRFGTLTSVLSVWTLWKPRAVVAAVLLLASTALAVAVLARRGRPGAPSLRRARGLAGAAGVIATALALWADPEFVTHTPAPFLALAASAAASLLSAWQARPGP